MRLRFRKEAAACIVLASEGYPEKPIKGDVITGIETAVAQEGVEIFHAGTAVKDGQLVAVLPVESDASTILFVCANPLDTSWKEELSSLIRKDIKIAVANPVDIQRYLNEFYSLAKSIHHATKFDTGADGQLIQNLEQLIELGRTGQLDAEDHHIIQVVDWLLQYAFEQRASDIHLEPRKEQGDIRFRIDGVLHHVYQVPPNVMTAIIGRIKTLGRMDIAEKRRPLDGRLKTKSPSSKEIELRLSTIPTAMGEKMVMRIFDPDVLLRSFEALGLTDRELSLWDKLTGLDAGSKQFAEGLLQDLRQ